MERTGTSRSFPSDRPVIAPPKGSAEYPHLNAEVLALLGYLAVQAPQAVPSIRRAAPLRHTE